LAGRGRVLGTADKLAVTGEVWSVAHWAAVRSLRGQQRSPARWHRHVAVWTKPRLDV